jgi:peptide/nickel transport system substrate-binding protein
MRRHASLAISILILLLAACTPAGGPDRREAAQPARAAGDRTSKHVSFAIQGEPKVLVTSLGLGNQPNVGGDVQGAVHRKLVTLDDRGVLHPQLAVELPTQERGSWIVRPDGTMRTTYSLRRDVTWHDGTPLTARDFVFALAVTTDAELPLPQGRLAPYVDRVEHPDEATLVIEWSQTYPFANAIVEDDLGPLPAHLLESLHRSDKERFQQLPYWTREFVGVGPYRVADWVLGSYMVLKAYDRFYAGPAKIDTVTAHFILSAPTAVANLLSGSLDGVIPATLDYQQAMFVKAEWERAGKKPSVIPQSVHWRTMAFQFRPEVASPRDLLDVRVRRALLSAVDRRAIVDTVFDGTAPMSDVFLPQEDFRWEWIKDAVVTYPYDVRRARELLAQAGWSQGSDGQYLTTTGQRATIAEWTTPGYEPEIAIIADNWKTIGIATDQVVLSPGEARDRQYVSHFPGVMTTTFPIRFEYWVERHEGASCPTEEKRWVGWNRGCYQNPERDRVTTALKVAIDPADQRPLLRELARIETEDLPALPLHFNSQVTVFRDGVTGVKRNTSPKTTATWNIEEWDVR